MAYQRAYIPVKEIYLSQGYGSKSSTHKLSYAIDLKGQQNVYAPFDCKVTKLYQPTDTKNHANTVWLTSTQKVLCPNGYYGYLTMSITHPSEISNMKVGYIYKQGNKICTTNTMTGNNTGRHIHLELSLGTDAGWSKKTSGNYTEYVIINKIKPEEYLFAYDNAVIQCDTYKGDKYNFIKEKDITYKVKGVPSEPLNIRDEKNKIIGGLKNGDDVIYFGIKNNKDYIYHYSILGYVAKGYLVK